MVMREMVFFSLMEHTVRLSILYPRPENNPMTFDSTPDSLSTMTAMACRFLSSVTGATA